MRIGKWLVACLLMAGSGAAVMAQKDQRVVPSTPGQALEYWVTLEEKLIVNTAEAMPADKYGFAPTNGEFNGVRTFGEQVKHLSATNFILGAGILGENPPADAGDEMGPDTVRTKPEIIHYLKDSFAYLHKAVNAIDQKNEIAPVKTPSISPLIGNGTRLGFAVETLMHGLDHYGQMVVYLRMNNVIPPASVPQSGSK